MKVDESSGRKMKINDCNFRLMKVDEAKRR